MYVCVECTEALLLTLAEYSLLLLKNTSILSVIQNQRTIGWVQLAHYCVCVCVCRISFVKTVFA
jgi:hypothetical protein